MSSSPSFVALTVAFFVITAFVSLSTAQKAPECIKYEVHERAANEPSQSQVLANDCFAVNGYLDTYYSEPFDRPGPVQFNTTFECCSNTTCQSDLECPFNFLCNVAEKRCVVATACELSDQVDLILNEGQDCEIDEDCTFAVPQDGNSWKCVAAPCPGGNCISRDKCKRCSKALPSRLVPTTEGPTVTFSPRPTTTVPTTTGFFTEPTRPSTAAPLTTTTTTTSAVPITVTTEDSSANAVPSSAPLISIANNTEDLVTLTTTESARSSSTQPGANTVVTTNLASNGTATAATEFVPFNDATTTTMSHAGSDFSEGLTSTREEPPSPTATASALPTFYSGFPWTFAATTEESAENSSAHGVEHSTGTPASETSSTAGSTPTARPVVETLFVPVIRPTAPSTFEGSTGAENN